MFVCIGFFGILKIMVSVWCKSRLAGSIEFSFCFGISTYCHTPQYRFQTSFILDQFLHNFFIVRKVDENGESVFCYRRIIFNQKFQIGNRLELVPLEE